MSKLQGGRARGPFQLFSGIFIYVHMGSFCRTGKMSDLCPFFLKSKASVRPNLIKIDMILQIILDICIFGIMKTLSLDLRIFLESP